MGEVVQMDDFGAVEVGDDYDQDEPMMDIAVDYEQSGQDLQLAAINDLAMRTENRLPELVLINGGRETHNTNCN